MYNSESPISNVGIYAAPSGSPATTCMVRCTRALCGPLGFVRIKGKKCPSSIEIGGIYAFGVCWVLIWWKLLLPYGVTQGKFLTLSVPQFLHLKMR